MRCIFVVVECGNASGSERLLTFFLFLFLFFFFFSFLLYPESRLPRQLLLQRLQRGLHLHGVQELGRWVGTKRVENKNRPLFQDPRARKMMEREREREQREGA